MTSPTPYQLLPRLTDDEYEALKADIAENGVRVPIDVDENGVILDGHHRAWITADLGMDCPRRTIAGLTDEQKRTHAIAVNIHRRSLNRQQKRDLIQRSLAEDPSLSDRQHAARTSADHKTVATQRAALEERGEIPHADTRTDSLGRQQPGHVASDDELICGTDWVMPETVAESADLVEMAGLETVTPSVEVRAPEPEPKPKRRPLPESFAEASLDLAKTAERLGRLTQDDRFTRNREQTHHQMPSLITALEHAAELVQAMRLDDTTASEEARRWWATSLNTISDTLTGVANSLSKEQ